MEHSLLMLTQKSIKTCKGARTSCKTSSRPEAHTASRIAAAVCIGMPIREF